MGFSRFLVGFWGENIRSLEAEFFGEARDEGFFARADGDKTTDAGGGKFAGKGNYGGFVDSVDEVGNAVVVFESVGEEVVFRVEIGDLADGLSAHLVAAESVAFAGFDVDIAEFAV